MKNMEQISFIKNCLAVSLLRAREIITRDLRSMLAEFDMTEQQWRVLRVLREESPLEATELANRSCILSPSLTRILRTLEKRDFIIREKDPSDSRRSLLALSREGIEMIDKITPVGEAIYGAFVERFGKEKFQQLLTLLHEIEEMQSS
ncbi:homoprotocatechuate degradation operon regulator HpaR [Bartonella sp. HY329]|uniref:homoprotocatechuate degradation operon regulator HpaR n=1 Tax=unclassified Bartonella TaxID=2645622 RepID=UPI0021C629B5|nr:MULTISPECIES: homoprotocatechuate degradation operon regulator HpaR [unclassified Bartonella]UXM94988.1 homoprotocatechuate degradation operon regulator HpaR [Bartonella sp. HY329]UXN09311.1 homoprotocatechuate degradation operon regulator HpaR [Bartonella sp. HY328]